MDEVAFCRQVSAGGKNRGCEPYVVRVVRRAPGEIGREEELMGR